MPGYMMACFKYPSCTWCCHGNPTISNVPVIEIFVFFLSFFKLQMDIQHTALPTDLHITLHKSRFTGYVALKIEVWCWSSCGAISKFLFKASQNWQKNVENLGK